LAWIHCRWQTEEGAFARWTSIRDLRYPDRGKSELGQERVHRGSTNLRHWTIVGLGKGGTPSIVTYLDLSRSERAVLFTIWTGVTFERPQIAVLSLKNHQERVLIDGATSPHYVSTGHLVYEQGGSLFAACATGIHAIGAVDLLCTFADGAACASRVESERFSTTMTAKANVLDFFVMTEPPADSTQYVGKSCFSIATTHNCSSTSQGEQAEPLFCGPGRKGKSPTVKHTGGPTRIVGGGVEPSGQTARGLHPLTVCTRASAGKRLPRHDDHSNDLIVHFLASRADTARNPRAPTGTPTPIAVKENAVQVSQAASGRCFR